MIINKCASEWVTTKQAVTCQKGWYILTISVLWKLKQEDNEFQASLGYIEKSCLKVKKKAHKQKQTKINSMTKVSQSNYEFITGLHRVGVK